ncbi:MAG: bifunctional metallophosphatase/5'-nucleotidase [Megasphaera micronuciformis]|nr:bifunctional metallophosphatase/5'-nucleotidase [Megasphaera micronuciformis]
MFIMYKVIRRFRSDMMKKMTALLGLAVACLCSTAFAADFSNLVIVHTNDSHGYDRRAEGINGMATVSALKKDFQQQGKNVILLDAGDAIQDNNLVNLSEGKTAIQFMNAAKYDAMALGNHEFDYGADVTQKRIKEAKFPVMSANIYVDATGKPFAPKTRTILKRGDIKIGVFGLTTPSTVTTSNPLSVRGLTFLSQEDLYKAAQREVDALKKDGVDLVVAVGHLGSKPDVAGDRSDDVLEHVKGIDIFIDGHDHTVKNRYVNGALLAETGAHLENIGVILYKDGKWQEDLYPYGRFTKEDPTVKKIVDKAQTAIDKKLSTVVGNTTVELNGARDPGVRTEETNLGDLIADAFLWQAQQAVALKGITVDGAIQNGGTIRSSIDAGKITENDVLRVMPYHNYLQYVTLKGAVLLEVLEAATCTTPQAIGAFPQVAGITYTVDTTKPYAEGSQYPHSTYYAPAKPGSRVTIATVGGKAFDPEATYCIAMPDYLTYGGDTYYALTDPAKVETETTGYLDVDSMKNYIQTVLGGTVGNTYAQPQGRITIVK